MGPHDSLAKYTDYVNGGGDCVSLCAPETQKQCSGWEFPEQRWGAREWVEPASNSAVTVLYRLRKHHGVILAA